MTRRARKLSKSKLVNAFSGNSNKSGKVQKGLLKAYYGVESTMVDKAFQGNKEACKLLGQMAQEGEDALYYGDKLNSALTSIIEGTNKKSEVMSNALKLAGSGAKAIRQQRLDVAYNGLQYNSAVQIQNANFINKVNLEKMRTSKQLEYIEQDYFVNTHLETVKATDRLNNLDQKVINMQKDEDKIHNREVLGAILEYNDETRVAPKAQYSLAQSLNPTEMITGTVKTVWNRVLGWIKE